MLAKHKYFMFELFVTINVNLECYLGKDNLKHHFSRINPV